MNVSEFLKTLKKSTAGSKPLHGNSTREGVTAGDADDDNASSFEYDSSGSDGGDASEDDVMGESDFVSGQLSHKRRGRGRTLPGTGADKTSAADFEPLKIFNTNEGVTQGSRGSATTGRSSLSSYKRMRQLAALSNSSGGAKCEQQAGSKRARVDAAASTNYWKELLADKKKLAKTESDPLVVAQHLGNNTPSSTTDLLNVFVSGSPNSDDLLSVLYDDLPADTTEKSAPAGDADSAPTMAALLTPALSGPGTASSQQAAIADSHPPNVAPVECEASPSSGPTIREEAMAPAQVVEKVETAAPPKKKRAKMFEQARALNRRNDDY